jgi:hypothetical protein
LSSRMRSADQSAARASRMSSSPTHPSRGARPSPGAAPAPPSTPPPQTAHPSAGAVPPAPRAAALRECIASPCDPSRLTSGRSSRTRLRSRARARSASSTSRTLLTLPTPASTFACLLRDFGSRTPPPRCGRRAAPGSARGTRCSRAASRETCAPPGRRTAVRGSGSVGQRRPP